MLGDARLASQFAEEMLKRGIYVIGFSYPVVCLLINNSFFRIFSFRYQKSVLEFVCKSLLLIQKLIFNDVSMLLLKSDEN